MTTLLQVEFPYSGPFGEEMARTLRNLAESIVNEPALILKIWTENGDTHEAGGVYLFQTREAAEHYLAKHTARMKAAGIVGVHGEFYDVNDALTAITFPRDISYPPEASSVNNPDVPPATPNPQPPGDSPSSTAHE